MHEISKRSPGCSFVWSDKNLTILGGLKKMHCSNWSVRQSIIVSSYSFSYYQRTDCSSRQEVALASCTVQEAVCLPSKHKSFSSPMCRLHFAGSEGIFSAGVMHQKLWSLCAFTYFMRTWAAVLQGLNIVCASSQHVAEWQVWIAMDSFAFHASTTFIRSPKCFHVHRLLICPHMYVPPTTTGGNNSQVGDSTSSNDSIMNAADMHSQQTAFNVGRVEWKTKRRR